MPIRVTCPGCGRSGNAPEGAAGKTVVCKGCGVAIVVPSAPDMPTALVTGPPPPQPVQPMYPPPPVYAPLPGVQYFPPVATSVPQAPLAFESEPLVTVSGSYRRAAKRNVDVEEKPAGVDVCGLFAIGVAILSAILLAAGLGSPIFNASTYLLPAMVAGGIAVILGIVGLCVTNRIPLALVGMLVGGACAAYAFDTQRRVEDRMDAVRRDLRNLSRF